MSSINRILIQTHHITSRKKISHLTKAAKRLSCAVLLKTGRSPGLMIAESADGDVDGEKGGGRKLAGAEEWAEIVRVGGLFSFLFFIHFLVLHLWSFDLV